MITYNALVTAVAGLHNSPSASIALPKYALSLGDWIPSVVDLTTSSANDELPVLVAFGANYATGPGKMPSAPFPTSPPPYVQANLAKPWRTNAIKHICNCKLGTFKLHWNSLLPFDVLDRNIPTDASIALGLNCDTEAKGFELGHFHFVMANLSPWISTIPWKDIRDNDFEGMAALISEPKFATGFYAYFDALLKIVGKDAIWMGHGNAEIYGFFRLLCMEIEIKNKNWFFNSNLTWPSKF